MNHIDSLFNKKGNNILSVYFTAGYPNLNDTIPAIKSLVENGADMIEVGIPFSDPMADGVVIQQSSSKALKNGMTLPLLLHQLADIRKDIPNTPLILMGYLNPIMQFGIEKFFSECKSIGIDGFIIPDLPFADYLRDFKPLCDKYGIHMIMLITPATEDERIRLIDANCSGFIYMVSSASTTGTKEHFGEEQVKYFKHIDSLGLKNPRLIGFGISNPETMQASCHYSCGGIIGSLFIKCLRDCPSINAATQKLIATLGC